MPSKTETAKQGTGRKPGEWYVSDGAILTPDLNDYGNFIVVECNRDRTPQDEERLRQIVRDHAAAPGLVAALERIAAAKPDRLDHSLDAEIVERAAKIARAALKKAGL